jgi:hypothetical protein
MVHLKSLERAPEGIWVLAPGLNGCPIRVLNRPQEDAFTFDH